jgi:hypothetical protein
VDYLPLSSRVRANVGADRGASWAPIILDVTIKARVSSADPIRIFVVVDSRPCAHEAEEHVSRGADDNSCVPAPHDQIARLRMGHALKSFDSGIEIVGARIAIGESGPFVNRVNQVGTVVSGMAAHFRIKRGRDHRQAVIRSQGALGAPWVPSSRRSRRGAGGPGLSRGLLRRADAQSEAAEQGCRQGFGGNGHRHILMPNWSVAKVTVVQDPDHGRHGDLSYQ